MLKPKSTVVALGSETGGSDRGEGSAFLGITLSEEPEGARGPLCSPISRERKTPVLPQQTTTKHHVGRSETNRNSATLILRSACLRLSRRLQPGTPPITVKSSTALAQNINSQTASPGGLLVAKVSSSSPPKVKVCLAHTL